MGVIEVALALREQKGRLERNTLIAGNIIRNTDFSNERIADLATVPIEFIKKMRAKFNKQKPNG